MNKDAWIRLLLRWLVILVFIAIGLLSMMHMPDKSYSGPFHPLSSDEVIIRDNVKTHVSMLADTIGERNIWHYDELEASATYIRNRLFDLGYEVEQQEYTVEGRVVKNIAAERIGTAMPEEIIIVGAHYDSVLGSPGANDNGSGVAAVLEIARILSNEEHSKTIRFVAFVNEEPPFFQTDTMGSRKYASRSHKRGEDIVAMISIETIGYYSDASHSQQYPLPFGSFYPNTGNFIGFVGNISSSQLLRKAVALFRKECKFPSEGVVAPGWITGIGWSDHWSFWKEGYPAIMVTDTAPFRYKHYHTRHDMPDKIGYSHMARVVAGMSKVVSGLAGITL